MFPKSVSGTCVNHPPDTGAQSAVAMGGFLDFASGETIFSRPTL